MASFLELSVLSYLNIIFSCLNDWYWSDFVMDFSFLNLQVFLVFWFSLPKFPFSTHITNQTNAIVYLWLAPWHISLTLISLLTPGFMSLALYSVLLFEHLAEVSKWRGMQLNLNYLSSSLFLLQQSTSYPSKMKASKLILSFWSSVFTSIFSRVRSTNYPSNKMSLR